MSITKHLKPSNWQRLSLLLFVAFLSLTTMAAKSDSTRVYTEQNPLVYEDAWDLWPYAFFNDNGEPDGFNIDLIRLIMKELNIPYIIKLRPQQQAFEDLRDRKSDLMLGLAVGFHDQYGLYGNNAITLFTQSVAAPKGKPTDIKTFRDLGKEGIKVIVNPNSMSYHLMIDYGWEKNAIPSSDLREVIQQVSAHEDGQIVWNTLSLKWLMNRYHIDNLQLTPVNMPHGEYKFMSNDQQLLDRLDEAYTKLYTADKITPLQDKWFYPDRLKPETPQWIRYALGIALLLIVFASAYAISYRIQSTKAQPTELDAQPATGPDTTDQPGENMDLRHREGSVCLAQRQRAGGLHLLDGGILAALQPRGLRETEDGPEPTGERHEGRSR